MIRYENAPWPLWRWDQNLKYIAKSFRHVPDPLTIEDQQFYQNLFEYQDRLELPRDTPALKISAVGDIMWIRRAWEQFHSEGISKQLSQSDIVFANLETPIDSTRPVPRWVYETLHYNSPASYLEPWIRLGDHQKRVFSVCNNHALDQGMSGLEKTRSAILKNPNHSCLGGLMNTDSVVLVETQGVRIACIATTFGINRCLDPRKAPEGIPIIPFGNSKTGWDQIQSLITTAQANHPDLVVLMPHWGFEYEYWPDSLMRTHAHRLIQMGVDIVLGSSPHVVQPVEIVSINHWDQKCPVQIQRKNSKPSAGIIAYSLGNFSTIMPTLPCQTGMILDIEFSNHSSGLLLNRLKVTPTVSHTGLGRNWLEARTLLLNEYPTHSHCQRNTKDKAHSHFQRVIGPLYQKESKYVHSTVS